MHFVITLTVADGQEGETLLEWLVFHLIDERRVDILRALEDGRVAVNRQAVHDPNTRLSAGMEVSYQQAGESPGASSWSGARGSAPAVSRDGKPKP